MGRLRLEGKLVWITGASSGIGRELAYICAMKGARVLLSSSNYTKLEKVWQDCLKISKTCHTVILDLEHSADFPDIVKRVTEKHGPVDILINNGGISQRSTVLETSEEVYRRIMEIDFMGTALLTKAVLPSMIESGGGQIAVTSSLSGLFGFPLRSGYAAAKHACHGFFETVRAEHCKDNVGVTIVCPGRIKTPISHSALQGDGTAYGKMDPGQENGMTARKCALKYIKAIEKRKRTKVIGGIEIIMAPIKRFFPGLFHYITCRISPT